MYAVVKTGGKQYKVTVGEKLNVEQIPRQPNRTKRSSDDC